MEDDEGGPRLSKRFSDKGEVDYKTKSGTAWSHSYLNQKPWHPLSYPNQRRKWIAEQTHAQRQRRADEIAREYAQEQDFLRQKSLLSQKEKEKVDIMQAVSFMYVRPPGYNAESAKAAEIADERRNIGDSHPIDASSSMPQEASVPVKEERKKSRPKDVFGRTLPTEEEFAVLKNAPRLETGVTGRVKPFAVEVRNVKCVRCGNFGHQSGDRECPLKDAIMPNEESRLKRDDPLTAIMAHMDPSEPLKWELKQKPGISPPRGGFQIDDPNQQIVAEDIFDEYGGFLGGDLPELLTSLSSRKNKRKSKSKRHKNKPFREDTSLDSDEKRSSKMKSKSKSQQESRRNRERNGPTSDDEGSQRSPKNKVKSSSKHKKRALHQISDSDSDDSTSGSYERKRRRKKDLRDKKRNNKDSSPSSISEESNDGSYYGKRRHKDSRHLEYSRRKLKESREEDYYDNKRKSIRERRTYKNQRSRHNDSECSSSDKSESERHTSKSKHSYS
ncbi:uncharacterized zinc finger CCHC domain-containing protein At4g19190 isoform X2 [Amaranthus tricolor]|uniref:uncharacterized zinc finger CCHC domain-containing protein At4g19190 isoform X2 n=1 Tax=Amaranthus tricolor TaxID=29722 RepID=UPI00258E4146|nr:uncharacterized zinc finger CCHC domain-containing protein At4g19190 isoform X2 [Amaranthus tricolor]